MDYMHAFQISASGMAVEQARMDATANNIAQAHTTRAAGSLAYQPTRVVVGEKRGVTFDATLATMTSASGLGGAEVVAIQAQEVPPRVAYEPGHPDADAKGYVAYPGIDTVTEMVTMMTAVRSYEANVAAFNAAKSMALKALDIGGAL